MRAITVPKEIYGICQEIKKSPKTIGLVPTMGSLHKGHMALVSQSLAENDVTVVSIFVNPIQFNNKEDLQVYPRTLHADLEKLAQEGTDFAFTPKETCLYPENPKLSISFGSMEMEMEGKYRPGHFNGMAIIVSKLLNLIQPNKAYFGMKDLQQFLIVKRLAKDLSYQVDIVGVETVREPSGLALSSRNLRLSKKGKQIATNIYKGLNQAAFHIKRGHSLANTLRSIQEFYESIDGLDTEYVSLVDPTDISPVKHLKEINELAICFAGYVEGVRLIDNVYICSKTGAGSRFPAKQKPVR